MRAIQAALLDLSGRLAILLAMLWHSQYPPVVLAGRVQPSHSFGYWTSTPMDRAVPSTIFMAATTSKALRSSIFCSAMART